MIKRLYYYWLERSSSPFGGFSFDKSPNSGIPRQHQKGILKKVPFFWVSSGGLSLDSKVLWFFGF